MYEKTGIERVCQKERENDRNREKDSIMVRLPNPLSERSI